MVRIVFVSDSDECLALTPGSRRLLADMPAVMAADYLQDMLMETLDAYNMARVRCGWKEVDCFPMAAAD